MLSLFTVVLFKALKETNCIVQMFGNAGVEHMDKYGTKPEHFAQIAWKNHKVFYSGHLNVERNSG